MPISISLNTMKSMRSKIELNNNDANTGRRCYLKAATCMVSALFLATTIALPGSLAHADVRKTDQVAGGSVESRALSASVCPSIQSEYAILVNSEGEVFFDRNSHTETNIASITKVMAAVVAMESADLNSEVYVSEKAAKVGESTAGLRAGDRLTLENALKAMMIPSGNDAAISISESVGKMISDATTDEEATRAFVSAMNEKAAELGCSNTVFANAHGLDFGEFSGNLHSSAYDVSLIVDYAMQNDLFRSIVDTKEANIPIVRDGAGSSVHVATTDELLGYFDGACGVKTGFTELAGACFAGACNRGDGDMYAIVLKSPTEAQRFTDTMTLYNWYYDHNISYQLANSDETMSVDLYGNVQDVPIVADVAITDRIDKTLKATFSDPWASVDIFTLYGNVSQSFEFFDVSGTVEVGDTVGKATFFQRNEPIAEIDLVSCEHVDAPNFFEGIQIGWQRFLNSFSGQNDVADSIVLNETPLVL